jgi:hypothetical protein
MLGDTQRDPRACVGRTQTVAKAWPLDEEEFYLTILPLRGVYLIQVLGVAWSFAQPRETSYI